MKKSTNIYKILFFSLLIAGGTIYLKGAYDDALYNKFKREHSQKVRQRGADQETVSRSKALTRGLMSYPELTWNVLKTAINYR